MLWLTKSTVRPAEADVLHLAEALALKLRVAHRQHLIDDQDLGVQVRGDREGQPHIHAGGITLHRRIEELLHARKIDDRVELAGDLLAPHAEDGAVEIDVLASGQLGMKAGADLEQAADAAVQIDLARARLGDAAEDLQQRALARAIAPDDADDLTLLDVEADVAQRREGFAALPAKGMARTMEEGLGDASSGARTDARACRTYSVRARTPRCLWIGSS